MSPPDLDRWLADPAVRTCHERGSSAGPEELWRAAGTVQLSDTRSLGRLVRWRIPRLPPGLAYRDLFADYPFTLLEEGGRHAVSGLCGRIWTLRHDYPRLDGPRAFERWSEPGTVRVLFAHWSEPAPGGGSRLFSEARVAPVDRSAARRLRALWTVVGPFERLIGAEPLALAARRAER